jgi:prepilin-type N-terminal cleavage/methylation domain-containing protein
VISLRLSASRTRRPAAMVPRRRSGMTLVEVIVSMMIMTGVLLALGNFTYRFSQAASQAHLTILANELAVNRLDEARQQQNYSSVLTMSGSRNVSADNRTFAESTYTKRTGGAAADLTDYTTVTVVITSPLLKKRITKTTAVAAY